MPNRQDKTPEYQLSANEVIATQPDAPVLVKTIQMAKGYVDKMHSHNWHQIIFPIKGLLQTQSDSYQYLLPHTSALFVPATLDHESIALSDTTFIGIYINPAFSRDYKNRLRTLYLTPFFKQLLQTTSSRSSQNILMCSIKRSNGSVTRRATRSNICK